MKPSHRFISNCRSCRYYNHEGRRGGFCRQLNVAVQGGWSACCLALPPFAPSWESVEGIMRWQQAASSKQAVGIPPAEFLAAAEVSGAVPVSTIAD